MVHMWHKVHVEMGHRVASGLPGGQWEEAKKTTFKTHSASQGNISIVGPGAGEKFLWWTVKYPDRFLVGER